MRFKRSLASRSVQYGSSYRQAGFPDSMTDRMRVSASYLFLAFQKKIKPNNSITTPVKTMLM